MEVRKVPKGKINRVKTRSEPRGKKRSKGVGWMP